MPSAHPACLSLKGRLHSETDWTAYADISAIAAVGLKR
jgi:hypothetical protein